MISKQKQAELRSGLFRHLDGIVTAPTAYTLLEKGLTDLFTGEKRVLPAGTVRTLQGQRGVSECSAENPLFTGLACSTH